MYISKTWTLSQNNQTPTHLQEQKVKTNIQWNLKFSLLRMRYNRKLYETFLQPDIRAAI